MNEEKMMQIIHDVFAPSLPRLGPGDDASTRRALEMLYGPGLESVNDNFGVLDIGCGNGSQTLRLAAELGCPVTAVDNHQPYLDELERRARAQGHAERIKTHCADMKTLDLNGETVDLVWAEGSISVMGVEEALRAWRSFLKPGGALGFTELTWLAEGAPEECQAFFASEYPQMTGAASLLETIGECGYEQVGHFTLPESSWWEQFYSPLAERLADYQPPSDDEESRAIIDMFHGEIDTCRRFSQWYGYVFFLLRDQS